MPVSIFRLYLTSSVGAVIKYIFLEHCHMASSSTLLGPILGAIVGVFGATVAAVIGAFITARLNQANTLAERHIGEDFIFSLPRYHLL